MLALPFRIKICGITSTDDLVAAVDAGADAIGLNFYPKSKRYVGDLKLKSASDPEDLDKVQFYLNQRIDFSSQATIIYSKDFVAAWNQRIELVGLFVNHSADEVNQIAAEWNLAWVQLHGDEPPEFLAELDPHLKIMRAYRTSVWNDVLEDLAACRTCGRQPDAVLIDAQVEGNYGGTGATADWQAMAHRDTGADVPPMILAGGLTPQNVAEAIRTVRPDGVDVASGVESAPGKKDPEKMQQFVAAAKTAWDSI